MTVQIENERPTPQEFAKGFLETRKRLELPVTGLDLWVAAICLERGLAFPTEEELDAARFAQHLLWKRSSDYDIDPDGFRLASIESTDLIAASYVAMRHNGGSLTLEEWCSELEFVGHAVPDGGLNERELYCVRCEVENLDPDLAEEE